MSDPLTGNIGRDPEPHKRVHKTAVDSRTGEEANAARDFLAEQFAGHRYVFAMHDPANDPKEEGEGGQAATCPCACDHHHAIGIG